MILSLVGQFAVHMVCMVYVVNIAEFYREGYDRQTHNYCESLLTLVFFFLLGQAKAPPRCTIFSKYHQLCHLFNFHFNADIDVCHQLSRPPVYAKY